MKKIIENELKTLVKVLKQNDNVKEIYLFGSFAYGNPTEQSDFDIYVVINDNSERPLIAMQRLGLEIAPYQKRPVDLLVGNVSHFETQKKLISTIENEIAEKGIKLYA